MMSFGKLGRDSRGVLDVIGNSLRAFVGLHAWLIGLMQIATIRDELREARCLCPGAHARPVGIGMVQAGLERRP